MIGHAHDQSWLEKQYRLIPRDLRSGVRYQYKTAYGNGDRQAANLQMLGVVNRVKSTRVDLARDDDLVRSEAEAMAQKCFNITVDRSVGSYGILRAVCEAAGVEPEEPKGDGAVYVAGAIERMLSPGWWRRRLRVLAKRSAEDLARDLQQVSCKKQIYCSNHTVRTRQQQRARSAALLELLEAVCVDTGEAVRLSEVAEHALSNPTVRRSELMVRIRGFDDYAFNNGHVSEFWTITLPSRYHANGSKTGTRLPNYQEGMTPRVGNQVLAKTWANIRSAFDKAGIKVYGFRVSEPQQDGTPHWHLLLFMEKHHAKQAREIARDYALAESPNEDGARKHRFTAVDLGQGAGKATGYIAKYIAKNIDGFGIDFDLFGNDAKAAAARVEAWASCWGIRQFQQVGGPPVGVWRELRRLDNVPLGLNPALRPAWKAADGGEWCEFLDAMGGPLLPRKSYPIQLYKTDSQVVVQAETNKYGEPVEKRLLGVSVDGCDTPLLTRLYKWKIEVVSNEANKNAVGKSSQASEGIRGNESRGAGGYVPAYGQGRSGVPCGKYDPDQYRSNGGRGFNAVAGVSRICGADRRSKATRIGSFSFQEGSAAALPWSPVNNCTDIKRRKPECTGVELDAFNFYQKNGRWPGVGDGVIQFGDTKTGIGRSGSGRNDAKGSVGARLYRAGRDGSSGIRAQN